MYDPSRLSFGDLSAANLKRQGEWDPKNTITPSYRGNELAGEVGEACNIIKKLERERLGIPGSKATLEQLADELADVVICADLLATTSGLCLGGAVIKKFNESSDKHGFSVKLIHPEGLVEGGHERELKTDEEPEQLRYTSPPIQADLPITDIILCGRMMADRNGGHWTIRRTSTKEYVGVYESSDKSFTLGGSIDNPDELFQIAALVKYLFEKNDR